MDLLLVLIDETDGELFVAWVVDRVVMVVLVVWVEREQGMFMVDMDIIQYDGGLSATAVSWRAWGG